MEYCNCRPQVKVNCFWWGFILFLPFLIFHWMIPFLSDSTLGNDYPRYAIQHQMELMLSLKTGSFPLYVPGFAGGQSSSALTLGQPFHPVSLLASILPGYWDGKALEWNTLLRLLSLGFAQLVLFGFLKKCRLATVAALVISFVTVYHFRMLDLFRYGASLESWTGHIFLCAAIGFYCLKPKTWYRPLAIIGAVYWLVCSGHPQMAYYGFIGAGIFTLVLPYFLKEMKLSGLDAERNVFQTWLRIGLYCLAGIALTAAYIVPFYFDFLMMNAGRMGQSYSWADTYRDSFIGTINNFFYPLRSDVHGVFGGSSLVLIAVIVPFLKLVKVKIPRVIWCIWAAALAAFLYIQGGRTMVHYLAWEYLPFASSFRIAGRFSLVLPVLFMLLLIWLARSRAIHLKTGRKELQITPLAALSAGAILLTVIYIGIPGSITKAHSDFSAVAIRAVPGWVEPAAMLSGTAALLLFVMYEFMQKRKTVAAILLLFFTGTQIWILLPYGTWMEPKQDTPSLTRMLSAKQEKLTYRFLPGAGLASTVVMEQVERSVLEPFLGKVYHRYAYAKNHKAAVAMMEQKFAPDLVVIENDKPLLESRFSGLTPGATPATAELIYSSFNRVAFRVWSPQPGFFGLAYPFTGNWRAYLDGNRVQLYRANGYSHTIPIPSGYSSVEFRYWSAAACWGMVVSCATLVCISVAVGFCCVKKRRLPGIVLSFCFLIIGSALFVLWFNSLYSGGNLNTVYTWKESPPTQARNLAYGKPTLTKRKRKLLTPGLYYSDRFYALYSSSLVVDGNRAFGSGLVTNLEREPYWVVDLQRLENIGTITVYSDRMKSIGKSRSVRVLLSKNGKKWYTAGYIKGGNPESTLQIEFEKPHKARYVMLRAIGLSRLILDEVEVLSHKRL